MHVLLNEIRNQTGQTGQTGHSMTPLVPGVNNLNFCRILKSGGKLPAPEP